jgi:hypothetical protein
LRGGRNNDRVYEKSDHRMIGILSCVKKVRKNIFLFEKNIQDGCCYVLNLVKNGKELYKSLF